jgi:hypothetical protein
MTTKLGIFAKYGLIQDLCILLCNIVSQKSVNFATRTVLSKL